jgi:nicotinate phosphoribosyltransferase
MNTDYLSPLLTDLYQLTMAAGYWHSGRAETEAVFHLTFRTLPFGGGYAVAAGLEDVIAWVRAFRFDADDLEYLATLKGNGGGRLFEPGFLEYLGGLRMSCDIDAIPEGTVVFPGEPLIRVRGPMVQAQLLETALLNLVNFQTLIATKAARICEAAGGAPVLEFGLRRAQGPDGAVMASRAAFVGGCGATSNVLAGKRLGIPVRGTHAHSWVMSFDSEREAFLAYVRAMPENATLLVDTYDTIGGVRHAIEAGEELRAAGHRLAGIRLDSGDLAVLSIEARRMLDAAGFGDAVIVASNDLDEEIIMSLRQQGAAIGVWGVGTKLVTGGGQGALGGVYKLGAIRGEDGGWVPKVKLSEQTAKVSTPGILNVRRFTAGGEFCGDAVYDELHGCGEDAGVELPGHPGRCWRVPEGAVSEDLLVPVFREGELVYEIPTIHEVQARGRAQLAMLTPAVRRLLNPQVYPAGIEWTLAGRKARLVGEAGRGKEVV